MKKTYLVAYDIANPERLRQVHRTVRAYGDRLQYSVYRCSLTEKGLVLLKAQLEEVMNLREDKTMFICLGPTGANTVKIKTLGVPFTQEEAGTILL